MRDRVSDKTMREWKNKKKTHDRREKNNIEIKQNRRTKTAIHFRRASTFTQLQASAHTRTHERTQADVFFNIYIIYILIVPNRPINKPKRSACNSESSMRYAQPHLHTGTSTLCFVYIYIFIFIHLYNILIWTEPKNALSMNGEKSSENERLAAGVSEHSTERNM